MKRPGIFFWLLLLPALVLCFLSLALAGFILSFFPPAVTWAVVGISVIVLAWFFLVRRRGELVTGSETSLYGRQSSKEGLL